MLWVLANCLEREGVLRSRRSTSLDHATLLLLLLLLLVFEEIRGFRALSVGYPRLS